MTCRKELASTYRLLHQQNIKTERGAASRAKTETPVESFVPGRFWSEMLPTDVTHGKPKKYVGAMPFPHPGARRARSAESRRQLSKPTLEEGHPPSRLPASVDLLV